MINANEILKALTLDEKIGQLLCYDLTALLDKDNLEEIENYAKNTLPGNFFIWGVTKEKVDTARKIFEK